MNKKYNVILLMNGVEVFRFGGKIENPKLDTFILKMDEFPKGKVTHNVFAIFRKIDTTPDGTIWFDFAGMQIKELGEDIRCVGKI